MATRRMISAEVICSDAFYELSHSAQALYFQLNIEADDDGFVARTKMITRCSNCTEEDLKELEDQNFIIRFDNGITVIVDWFRQNTLRGDRYHETAYQDLKKQLRLDDKSKKYAMVSNLATKRQPIGNQKESNPKPDGANPLPQKERKCSIERKKEKAAPSAGKILNSEGEIRSDSKKAGGKAESKSEKETNTPLPFAWETKIPKVYWGRFAEEDDYYDYAASHSEEVLAEIEKEKNPVA